MEDEQCPAQNPRNTSSTQLRWNSPTPFTRSKKSIYRQEAQRWIGHEPATNHCETVPSHHEDCRGRIRSSRDVNHVTEHIKTPQIQCAQKRDPPGAVYRHDHVHKMQKKLKLPQVQYINKTTQKVQQITEVSKQHYTNMNVDVPAGMQYQNIAPHRHCRKLRTHNRFHSLDGTS